MNSIRVTLAALILVVGSYAMAGEVTPVDDATARKVISAFMERTKAVSSIHATVYTTKTGGRFSKAPTTSLGEFKFQAPRYFRFIDKGLVQAKLPEKEWALWILDGQYLWEMMPPLPDEPREVERRSMKTAAEDGENVDMASFLIGSNIATVDELYDQFEITAVREGDSQNSYRFTLVSKKHPSALPAKRNVTTTIWLTETGALPWKVLISIQTTDKGPGGMAIKRTQTIERRLEGVRTNLTDLKPFGADTFVFPYTKNMVILNEAGDEVLPATVKQDLKAIRAELTQKLVPQKD